MIELKANFKSVQKNLTCRLCGAHEENQPGLLICQTLNANTDISTGSPPQYSDLYSHDKNKITVISKILQDKYQAFKTYQVHRIFPCAATVTFKQTNVKNVSVELDIKKQF